MMYNAFIYCWVLLTRILLKTFVSMFMREIDLYIFLLLLFLYCLYPVLVLE